MKPVFQTQFEDGRGDCFRACVASLLEVSIEGVPNFRAQQTDGGPDMLLAADKWLRANHGKRLIAIELCKPNGGWNTEQTILSPLAHANEGESVILFGVSPRRNANGSTKYHAVLGRADTWGFDLSHDPHPDGGGIVGEPFGVLWMVMV